MTDGTAADGIRGTAHGTAPVPLSVLDLVTVGAGRTATDALRTGVELSRLAESRGYHRYWVAEHHSMPGVASSSPAVILAHLAAHTERIRLGSGGVMLPNHAPLVIAEQFGTLEALAPGRDRPRPRPRPRHRRRHRRRAAPHRPAQRGRRRLPAAARGADPLPRRRLPRRPPLPPHPRRARPRAGHLARRRAVPAPAAALAARLLRLQRPARRHARPAVRLRPPLLGAEHRPRARPVPRVVPALRGPGRAVRPDRRRRARHGRGAGGPPPGAGRRASTWSGCAPAAPASCPRPRRRRPTSSAPMEREFVDSWNANVIHGTADEVAPASTTSRSAPAPTS